MKEKEKSDAVTATTPSPPSSSPSHSTSSLYRKTLAVFHTTVSIWIQPMRDSLTELEWACKDSLSVGDQHSYATLAFLYFGFQLLIGYPLRPLLEEVQRLYDGLSSKSILLAARLLLLMRVMMLYLNEASKTFVFNGREWTLESFIDGIDASAAINKFRGWTSTAYVAMHERKFEHARNICLKALEHLTATWGSGMLPHFNYVYALILCQQAMELDDEEELDEESEGDEEVLFREEEVVSTPSNDVFRSSLIPPSKSTTTSTAAQSPPSHPPPPQPRRSNSVASSYAHVHHLSTAPTYLTPYKPSSQTVSAYLSVVAFLHQPLRTWARACPSNYLMRCKLVEAEWLHVLIRKRKGKGKAMRYVLPAMQAYDEAIEAAHTNGWLQEEALAHELAARFYLYLGRNRAFVRHLRHAFQTYTVWQCTLKTESLWQEFKPTLERLEQMGKIQVQQVRRKRNRDAETMTHRITHNNNAASDNTETDATALNQAMSDDGSTSASSSTPSSLSHSNASASSTSTSTSPSISMSAGVGGSSGSGGGAGSNSSSASTASTTGSTSGGSASGGRSNPLGFQTFPGVDLDLTTLMRACQAFSVETDLEQLHEKLMWIVLQHAGASRGRLIMRESQISTPRTDTNGNASDTPVGMDMSDGSGMTIPMTSAQQVTSSNSDGVIRDDSSNLSSSCAADGDTWRVLVAAEVEDVPQPHPQWLLDSLAEDERQQHASRSAPHTVSPTPLRIARPDVNGNDAMEAQQTLEQTIPLSVLHSIISSRRTLVLTEAELNQPPFSRDVYFSSNHAPRSTQHPHPHPHPHHAAQHGRPKSVLCVPILKQSALIGMLYLESDYNSAAFSPGHVQLLQLLCAQAALSYENAKLFKEMKSAKESAEQGSRSKTEFLCNMSHEIRTPLNAVLGIARLLADTNLSLEQQSYVSMINSSGQLLLSIITDILDLSRIESGKLDMEYAPFSLFETVENSVQLCWNLAHNRNIDIGFSFSPEISVDKYMGDATHLMQVLLNLVANGIKFTKPNTSGFCHVSIELAKSEHLMMHNSSPLPSTSSRSSTPASGSSPSGLMRVTSASPTPITLKFAVRDSGCGIAAAAIPRLFQNFSQADASTVRQYGGSGLGLVICKRLLEAMHGRIWLESEEGKGSTVHFTLPLTPVTDNNDGNHNTYPHIHSSHAYMSAVSGSCGLTPPSQTTLRSFSFSPIARCHVPVELAPMLPGLRTWFIGRPGRVHSGRGLSAMCRGTGMDVRFIEDLQALESVMGPVSTTVQPLSSSPAIQLSSAPSQLPSPPPLVIVDASDANYVDRVQTLLDDRSFNYLGLIVLLPPRTPNRSTNGKSNASADNSGGAITSSVTSAMAPGIASDIVREEVELTCDDIEDNKSGRESRRKRRKTSTMSHVTGNSGISQATMSLLPRAASSSLSMSGAYSSPISSSPSASPSMPFTRRDPSRPPGHALHHPCRFSDIMLTVARVLEETGIMVTPKQHARPSPKGSSGSTLLVRSEEMDTQIASPHTLKRKREASGSDGSMRQPTIIKPTPLSLGSSSPVMSYSMTNTRTSFPSALPAHVVGTSMMSRAVPLHGLSTVSPSSLISPPMSIPASLSPASSSSSSSSPSPTPRCKFRPVHARLVPIAHEMPLNILLVEDNKVNQKMMKMYFSKLGYAIDIASNGEMALQMVAKKWKAEAEAHANANANANAATTSSTTQPTSSVALNSHAYGLIIMDICMELMDGLECTRQIRSRQPSSIISPFIIAHSADALPESQARCFRAGCETFMQKPVQLDQLTNTIKQAYQAIQQQKKTLSSMKKMKDA